AVPRAPAQQVASHPVAAARPGDCLPPPPPCATPSPVAPGAPTGTPSAGAPSPFDFTTSAGAGGLDLAGGLSVAAGGEPLALDGTGYIAAATPRTQTRVRFDAAYDDNRPDRAEFFYAKCGCFRQLALAGGPGGDPRAPGPPKSETRVDYQDISTYLELA